MYSYKYKKISAKTSEVSEYISDDIRICYWIAARNNTEVWFWTFFRLKDYTEAVYRFKDLDDSWITDYGSFELECPFKEMLVP